MNILTKLTHFLVIKQTYKLKHLATLYAKVNMRLPEVPLSILTN